MANGFEVKCSSFPLFLITVLLHATPLHACMSFICIRTICVRAKDKTQYGKWRSEIRYCMKRHKDTAQVVWNRLGSAEACYNAKQ